MEYFRKVVRTNKEPDEKEVLWVDTAHPDYPVMKYYENGNWKLIRQREDGVAYIMPYGGIPYSDLSQEVKMAIASGGAQANWNQTNSASPDFIWNKPYIPTALADLTEDSNHKFVSAAEKTSWNNKADASAIPDVSNKADKVLGATSGHLAALDSNGNLTDSGKSASDFATAAQGAKADTSYQKPATGIPESDLAGEVKVKLKETLYISSLPTSDITSTDDLNDVISRSTLLKLAEGESSALIYNQLTEYGMSESDFAQTECVITKASKIVGDRNNKCELTFVLNGYEYAITADYDTRVATVTVTAVQDITSMQSYSYGVTAPSDPKEGDIWVSETLTEIPIAENANELTFTKTASRYKLTLSGLANNDSAIFEWYRASDSKPFESDEYKPDGTYYFDAPDYEIKDNELCLYLIYTDNLWEVATLWAVANTVYQYHNGSWVAMEVVTATEKAAWNAKQNALTFDSTPTADSTNPVTSGGVKAYVDGAIPTVPTISTDITADATSDAKTTSPKAVKTFVEGKGYGTYSKPSGGIPAADIAAGVIPTVPTDVVKYSQQSLTDEQKTQARTNIGAGTYSKPSGGIPKADLVQAVQDSLGKADGALQGIIYDENSYSGINISLARYIATEYRTPGIYFYDFQGEHLSDDDDAGEYDNYVFSFVFDDGTGDIIGKPLVFVSNYALTNFYAYRLEKTGSGNNTKYSLIRYADEDWVNAQGFLKSFTETDPTVPSWAKQPNKPSYSYSEISNTPNLATVATSGSYNDLSNKPTIPDEVEANPTVPSGTTPGTMETIKIGSQYYELGGGTIDAEDYSGTAPLLVDPSNYYTKVETEALVETPVASTQPSGGFLPNVIYDLGEITGSVTFALAMPTDNTIANTYVWTFETDSTAPTIVWPANLTWLGGSAPTINTGKHYEITVRKGYANCLEF